MKSCILVLLSNNSLTEQRSYLYETAREIHKEQEDAANLNNDNENKTAIGYK